MKPDLNTLKRQASELPDDEDRLKLLRLIEETQDVDRQLEIMRAKEDEQKGRLRRKSLLVIPILLVAAVGFMWYLTSALSDGYVTHRQQVISYTADPVNFWFRLAWPAAGVVSCVIAMVYLFRFSFFAIQNTKQ